MHTRLLQRWWFTLLLITVLVGSALLTTSLGLALMGDPAQTGANSYYYYLPMVFNQLLP